MGLRVVQRAPRRWRKVLGVDLGAQLPTLGEKAEEGEGSAEGGGEVGPGVHSKAEKAFLLRSEGRVELEAWLDRGVFAHGEHINVRVAVRNRSSRTVRRIKVLVVQHVDVCMFSNGKFKNVVASERSSEGCPLLPGATLLKTYPLRPTRGATKNWIALQDTLGATAAGAVGGPPTVVPPKLPEKPKIGEKGAEGGDQGTDVKANFLGPPGKTLRRNSAPNPKTSDMEESEPRPPPQTQQPAPPPTAKPKAPPLPPPTQCLASTVARRPAPPGGGGAAAAAGAGGRRRRRKRVPGMPGGGKRIAGAEGCCTGGGEEKGGRGGSGRWRRDADGEENGWGEENGAADDGEDEGEDKGCIQDGEDDEGDEDDEDRNNVFAIYVSYYVKVKAVMGGAMGGAIAVKLPFSLVQPEDDDEDEEDEDRQQGPIAADTKVAGDADTPTAAVPTAGGDGGTSLT